MKQQNKTKQKSKAVKCIFLFLALLLLIDAGHYIYLRCIQFINLNEIHIQELHNEISQLNSHISTLEGKVQILEHADTVQNKLIYRLGSAGHQVVQQMQPKTPPIQIQHTSQYIASDNGELDIAQKTTLVGTAITIGIFLTEVIKQKILHFTF